MDFIRFILLCVFNAALIHPTGCFDVQRKVIGTVVSICNRGTLHTPFVQSLMPNASQPSLPALWVSDFKTKCLRDSSDVLAYCKNVYSLHGVRVSHVMPVPFPVAFDKSSVVSENPVHYRAFWCLSHLNNEISNSSHAQNVPFEHHLPTLLDVHRAYFEERFKTLLNDSRSNVSHIIQSLVAQMKGIRELGQHDSDLAQFMSSKLLQEAHTKLERVWSKEESEWAKLEQARHADFVKQLDEEDWNSQKALTYALQESGGNIDRIQDSVARLLTSLNASVQEEIRHFNAVYTDQPWMLRLDTRLNWTDAVSSHLTSVERVHQVLLVYVRQATTAINTLRELMKGNLHRSTSDESATPVISSTPLYKPILLKSYKQLQESLYTAQALLNSANQVLLTNLNTRSQELLSHFNRTVHNEMTPPDSNVPLTQTSVPLDWVRTKHYAELAYIDLLVNHILRSDNWNMWSDFAKENEGAPNPRHYPHTGRWLSSSSSWILSNHFTLLLTVFIGAGLLFTSVILLLVFWIFRNRSQFDKGVPGQDTTLVVFLKFAVHKVKYWIRPSTSFRSNHRPWLRWIMRSKSGNTRSSTLQIHGELLQSPEHQVHGYFNPVYPPGRSC